MPKDIRSSLTAKLFLITGALLATVCVFTYAFIAWFMPQSYRTNLASELESKAAALVQSLREVPIGKSGEMLNLFTLETGAQLTLLDAEGKAVAWPQRYFVQQNDSFFITVTLVTNETDQAKSNDDLSVATAYEYSAQTAMETLGVEVWFADSEAPYTLLITSGMQAVNQAVLALSRSFPLLVGIILLMSALGALLYSRYITRPIVRLSSVARKLATLDFSWQGDVRRKDEIGILAQSLNALSAQLSAALEELRQANQSLQGEIARERDLQRRRTQFFSAVSHELKTPLTIIKGQLEGMIENLGVYENRDEYLRQTLSAAESMERMVLEILTVLRLERDDCALRMAPVDLSALLAACAQKHAALFAQAGQSFDQDIEPALAVQADAALLRRALDNLFANAAQHSKPGATIRLRAAKEPDAILCTLENSGVQIPADALPHLYEAFYRADPSRNRRTGGTGLGLHIVSTILNQHGIVYRIENTEEGVCVTLRFPYTQNT